MNIFILFFLLNWCLIDLGGGILSLRLKVFCQLVQKVIVKIKVCQYFYYNFYLCRNIRSLKKLDKELMESFLNVNAMILTPVKENQPKIINIRI